MKKLSLVLALLVLHHITICQVVKPFNLKDFEGKKIVSLFKSSVEMRGDYPDAYVAPTNQYHTVNRSISFQKSNENTLIEKILNRVNISVENMVTLERDEFDTDKRFDRHEMATMVYGRYDKVVDRPYKMIYNPQIKRIDTLSNFTYDNFYFDMASCDYMLPVLQDEFTGFFQMSLPTEPEWKIGQTWQQTILRKSGIVAKNENITNTYTVKAINNDVITLEVKGINIPEQVIYKRSDGYVNNTLKDNKTTTTDKITYKIEQKSGYEGTIKLDAKTNFILKLEIVMNNLKKIQLKDKSPAGPEIAYIVSIENKLEDLK